MLAVICFPAFFPVLVWALFALSILLETHSPPFLFEEADVASALFYVFALLPSQISLRWLQNHMWRFLLRPGMELAQCR